MKTLNKNFIITDDIGCG